MSSMPERELSWVRASSGAYRQTSVELRYLVMLLAILVVGLLVRLNGLGAVGLHSDEKYTFPAALGVLETGLPILSSGMLYPRALLQTYLMAGSVMLFGESEWAFRLPSAIVGTLCIPVAYLLGRKYLRPALNLGFAASVALLPSFIEISQIARMYGFLVLCVLLFLLALSYWERQSSWKVLACMLAVMVVGLQIQPLMILALPLIFVPLLTDPSFKRFMQAGLAMAVSCSAYIWLGRWAGDQYGDRVIEGSQNFARHPDPIEIAGFQNLPIEFLLGLFVLVLAGVVVVAWSVFRRVAHEGIAIRADTVFLLFGTLGLIISLTSAALVSYLVAALAFCVGTAFHVRGGGGMRTVILVGAAVALIFSGQAIFLVAAENGSELQEFIKFFIAFPSPVPEMRFFQFFPLAVILFGSLCALDVFRFARGSPLPPYVLLFAFGVLAPMLVLGVVAWTVAPRFLIGLVPVFLFCLFLCVDGYLERLPTRFKRYRQLEGFAALALVALLVPPGALSDAMARTYGPYPDHKGAAEFIRDKELDSTDMVIALDVSIQSYYLEDIDYWLRHIRSSGYFSREEDGALVEIYTGIPVLSDAESFERVLNQEGRGNIYVIGSGEIDGDHHHDYVLGQGILDLFDEYNAEVVFTGRDAKTLIWQFHPGNDSERKATPYSSTAERSR